MVDCLRTLRFDEALSDRVEGARHAVLNGGWCLCEDRPLAEKHRREQRSHGLLLKSHPLELRRRHDALDLLEQLALLHAYVVVQELAERVGCVNSMFPKTAGSANERDSRSSSG